MSATTPALSLRDASITLGSATIWQSVSADVRRGEFVGVLGPNGAGKSTLLRAILGLLPLSQGSITVLGERPRNARQRIGYLPQRRVFNADARVRGSDIIRLGLDGARWGFPLPFAGSRRGAVARRVAEVIELVDADSYAERSIGELSGGEQQRLLIAQALVRRPELLLLDEPLDALDLPNQANVAVLVQRICRAENVAVLLVAHDVNPLLGYLDQVIYLAGGRAAQGSVSDVITGPTLSALYGVPIEVLRTSDERLVVVGQPEAPAHHHDRHAG
ncbi:MAG: metal ABC transporter ATP-binding protein [Solirubrobacteraceae bacterium]|nr:MAG: metal ABC transporter ATP-binding protein [Solirubrobacterales bacterium]